MTHADKKRADSFKFWLEATYNFSFGKITHLDGAGSRALESLFVIMSSVTDKLLCTISCLI